MPATVDLTTENVNEGASTSATVATKEQSKEDKKKNQPWIEKYRPQKFEEIMGELIFNLMSLLKT